MCCGISIHTPLAGSDWEERQNHGDGLRFQSTLPLRGATWSWCRNIPVLSYFNPHSPCGERPFGIVGWRVFCEISIHTPLAGSDVSALPPSGRCGDFNPHSPCGERPDSISHVGRPLLFQSTLPLRGAIWMLFSNPVADSISIHTPLAGSDLSTGDVYQLRLYFNPHSPCGERSMQESSEWLTSGFQSTLPLRGAIAKMRHF
mgnify:FL=1